MASACKSFAALLVVAFLGLIKPSLGGSSTATFYTPPYQPSACFGGGPLPSDFNFVAAAPSLFDDGAACAKHFCIRCTGDGCKNSDTIRVQVVDLCPGCRGDFDLSQEAFAAIADPDAGVIDIKYKRC